MKLSHRVVIIALSISLLSGCAYIQGVKDQKAADAAAAKATPTPNAKNQKKVDIAPDENPSMPANTDDKGTSNASKMIAPLTQ